VPPEGGAPTTTVTDTVYLADGTPAAGNLIISWPAFVTGGGTAVAAGTTNVALGTKGSLSVELVPNAGATPAGVYYSVVYQIGPGQVKTEYWVVPSVSPANLATVRTMPGSGLAAQPVSMQYVNSALSTKADDTSVVHVNGAETISGTKTFSGAPNVPAPSGTGSVVNKAYVDQAVANVGAGSYLSTAGGTVTGPITLAGNALATVDAIAAREIVNPEEFRAGISKIIDGTVTCLDASTWAKGGAKSSGSSAVSN
jgi:baseplate protein BppL